MPKGQTLSGIGRRGTPCGSRRGPRLSFPDRLHATGPQAGIAIASCAAAGLGKGPCLAKASGTAGTGKKLARFRRFVLLGLTHHPVFGTPAQKMPRVKLAGMLRPRRHHQFGQRL